MLEHLTLAGVATYTGAPTEIRDLKPINFFFGPNGSGKTTLARVLDDPGRFPKCKLEWGSGADVLVYNRDFVERNFSQTTQLNGIFTLGEDSVGIQSQITEKKKALEDHRAKTSNLGKTREQKETEKDQLSAGFRNDCWSSKERYSQLSKALVGCRGSKERLANFILQADISQPDPNERAEELAKQIDVAWDESASTSSLVDWPRDLVQELSILEKAPTLATPLIGAESGQISRVIKTLSNSDWMRRGLSYLGKTSPTCPFCQQHVSGEFRAELEKCFDEEYQKGIEELKRVLSRYESVSSGLQNFFRQIDPNQFENETFTGAKDRLKAVLAQNKILMDKKLAEPSQKVTLAKTDEVLNQLKRLVDQANEKLTKQNAILADQRSSRTNLTRKVQEFLNRELRNEIDRFDEENSNVEKALLSIEQSIEQNNQRIETTKRELEALEAQITSITPTVNAINKMLASFGFDGFTIAETNGFYQLQRPDGTAVEQSLSEGEQNFVTFLYFYQLISGSLSSSGTSNRRVIVIDDPVSSLDSSVLFIVTILIRKLIAIIRSNESLSVQLILLTHNIYFHKEVAFNPSTRNSPSDQTFWTLKKVNNRSCVQKHPCNPIKTSYELLWTEFRDPDSSEISIRNTMRRILEYYFKILGKIEFDNLIDQFDTHEQLIGRALLSWIHDGSHFPDDPLFLQTSSADIAHQKQVFKRIFEEAGHLAHYELMMGE